MRAAVSRPRAATQSHVMSRLALKVRLERRQLSGPKLLGLIQPGLQLCHRFGPEAINPHPRVERWMRFLDQTARAQGAEMPAHRRRAEARCIREFTSPTRPLAQQLDDLTACRVGKRGERAIDDKRVRQTQPSIFSPLAFSASSRETCCTFWPKLQTWPSGSRAE